VLGPVIAAIALGLLVLIVKWAFRRGPRVAPSHGVRLDSDAATHDLQPLRRAGIRSTVARAADGRRLLVWPADTERARIVTHRVLRRP